MGVRVLLYVFPVPLALRGEADWLAQVRLWYATRMPSVRLGNLVSVWTNHSKWFPGFLSIV